MALKTGLILHKKPSNYREAMIPRRWHHDRLNAHSTFLSINRLESFTRSALASLIFLRLPCLH